MMGNASKDQLKMDLKDSSQQGRTCPEYCTHPERQGRTCRGCENSLNPKLFDGGCKNLLVDDL